MSKLRTVIAALFALLGSVSLAQSADDFHTKKVKSDRFENFTLNSHYYTIEKNLRTKKSPLFMTNAPTVADYLHFARTVPSYYFTVDRADTVVFSILIHQRMEGVVSRFEMEVFEPYLKRRITVPCTTGGDLTEMRAAEMLQWRYDTNARTVDMPNGVFLHYGGAVYQLQSFFHLREEVVALARKLLEKKDATARTPMAYLRRESLGGKLDFEKSLANTAAANEVFNHEGMALSRSEYAAYLWGQAAAQLGVKSMAEAKLLWVELYQKPLLPEIETALGQGFKTKASP